MVSGYIECDEAKVYYEFDGLGDEVLVIIHGNGESMKAYKEQLEYFKKYYRVLSVDSRGHGNSTMGRNGLSLKSFASDTIKVMNFLSIKKASFLGFSDGANVAMYIAGNYKEYADKVILVGGNTVPSGIKISAQIPIILGYFICKLIAIFDKRAVLKSEILRLMVNEPNISKEMLNSITAKVLVIAGEHDLIKEKHTRYIASNILNSELCIIKNADHFVGNKQPMVLNKIVHNFLNR